MTSQNQNKTKYSTEEQQHKHLLASRNKSTKYLVVPGKDDQSKSKTSYQKREAAVTFFRASNASKKLRRTTKRKLTRKSMKIKNKSKCYWLNC